MKKYAALALAICALLPTVALSDSTTLSLYSSATNTTVAVSGTAKYAPFAFGAAGCDIKTSPTATVTVRFDGGNNYDGLDVFDTAGIISAVTCSTATCNKQLTGTFLGMRAVVTTASSYTQSIININCLVR